MKQERTTEQPAFNVLKDDGVREMGGNKVITKVFTTSGIEHDVIPGTFKFLKTPGDRPIPFVQFQTKLSVDVSTELDITSNIRHITHTVELFPVSVAGVAFLAVEEEPSNLSPEMLG